MNVVINREDRPERLIEAKRQLDQYGLEFEVFPAIINKIGWMGCRNSHLKVLELYKDEPTLTIFEDDVKFLSDPIDTMIASLKELPKEWDLLYLGVSPQEPFKKYSDHLYRAGHGYCAHAISYNTRSGVIDYILKHKQDILKWDVYLSSMINKQFNCFVAFPILCTQVQHKSDTCIRTDSSTIVKNYNRFCNDTK